MGKVIKALREKYDDRYVSSDSKVGYPIGLLEFDYKNGKIIETEVIEGKSEGEKYQYHSLGIEGGSIVTILGPSGAGKTAFALQIGARIADRFPDAAIIHNDIEGATSETRFKNISGWDDRKVAEKYVLKSDDRIGHNYLMAQVEEIYQEKMAMKKELMYNTGMKNKYGADVHILQPTIIITDSLANLIPEDVRDTISDDKELKKAARFPMECAKANKQLIMYMTPMLKAANIIYIFINHVHDKISMSITPEKNFINYMPHNKEAPGGRAPQYNANNVFYMEENSGGKLKVEKGEPFDGFLVKCIITKSRANRAGQVIILPYNQASGFSATYHIYELLKRHDLLVGKSPNIKIRGYEDRTDLRFKRDGFIEKFNQEPELRKIALTALRPILEEALSQSNAHDDKVSDNFDMYDVMAEGEEDLSNKLCRIKL